MKAQITLKNGVQITVDVDELTTGRNALTNDLQSIKWTTPEIWAAKLHMIELDEIVAIVMLNDQQQAAHDEKGGQG